MRRRMWITIAVLGTVAVALLSILLVRVGMQEVDSANRKYMYGASTPACKLVTNRIIALEQEVEGLERRPLNMRVGVFCDAQSWSRQADALGHYGMGAAPYLVEQQERTVFFNARALLPFDKHKQDLVLLGMAELRLDTDDPTRLGALVEKWREASDVVYIPE